MAHPTVNIAVKAARKAGDIILRSLDKVSSIKIEEKGHNDWVTNIDKAAEAAIVDSLHSVFPRHNFLTEETGIIDNGDPEHVWIIDPLDGTTNFLHGLPQYVVSIALQHNGIITQAVVYDPVKNEIGRASC